MYLDFWPVSLDRFGNAGDGSGVYSWPFPASQLAQNRARTDAVEAAAARAYIASQTVAPDMLADFLNSTGSGAPTPGELVKAGGAGGPAVFTGPAVLPLNPSSWSAPLPYRACPGPPPPGVPWNDALYSTADSPLSEGLWKHKGWLLLLAALGVAGLASARKGRK